MSSKRIYLRRKQAADYLQHNYGAFTVGTLAKLACIGGGPQFLKCGKYPLYTPEDLDAWAESRMSATIFSTSQLHNSQKTGECGGNHD